MDTLTRQQEKAIEYVQNGKNMFLTGAGGTGKSFLLRHIISISPRLTTYVAAYTGIAAINIGGQTLHKTTGIGLGNGTVDDIMAKLGRQGRLNLTNAKLMIIDEISMLSGQLFDKLEEIARRVRKNDLPFGGIQLLLCGDFYQCPPINKKYSDDDEDMTQCFEAETWNTCVNIQYELTEIIRQKESLALKFVNAIRESDTDKRGVVQLDSEWIELMDYLSRPLKTRKDGILPTRLYCKNKDVDRENMEELNRLPGEQHTFKATDTGTDPWLKNIETDCIAADELHLKIGAQVMLIKNSITNPSLVNGSRGIVVRFELSADPLCKSPLPVVHFKNGVEEIVNFETWTIEDRHAKVLASRTQIALKLATCITCHKSQGMSIDYLEIDISDAFDYGIAYVALTRFTTLTGFRIKNYNLQKIKHDPKVVNFMRNLRKRPENME